MEKDMFPKKIQELNTLRVFKKDNKNEVNKAKGNIRSQCTKLINAIPGTVYIYYDYD